MARQASRRDQLYKDIDDAVASAAAELETVRSTVEAERARLEADAGTPNGPAATGSQ